MRTPFTASDIFSVRILATRCTPYSEVMCSGSRARSALVASGIHLYTKMPAAPRDGYVARFEPPLDASDPGTNHPQEPFDAKRCTTAPDSRQTGTCDSSHGYSASSDWLCRPAR